MTNAHLPLRGGLVGFPSLLLATLLVVVLPPNRLEAQRTLQQVDRPSHDFVERVDRLEKLVEEVRQAPREATPFALAVKKAAENLYKQLAGNAGERVAAANLNYRLRALALTKRWAPITTSRSASAWTRSSRTSTHG